MVPGGGPALTFRRYVSMNVQTQVPPHTSWGSETMESSAIVLKTRLRWGPFRLHLPLLLNTVSLLVQLMKSRIYWLSKDGHSGLVQVVVIPSVDDSLSEASKGDRHVKNVCVCARACRDSQPSTCPLLRAKHP